jgi:hypothetical protein
LSASGNDLKAKVNARILNGGIMKAKDLMITFQERLKPDTTLREVVNILRTTKRDDEKSGVKGGFNPC